MGLALFIRLIVGLHFIGLWKATGRRSFITITVAMCLISTASIFLPQYWHTFGLRSVFLGTGNAIALWIGAGRMRS